VVAVTARTESNESFDDVAHLQLGETVDDPAAPFSEDDESPLRATVEKDDTRSLRTVGDATEAFEDYLKAKEHQTLVFEDQNSGDYLVRDHEHRWSPEYRRRTYARLKAAERHVASVWGEAVPTTLLTLTAPHDAPDGSPRSFEAVLSDLKDGWDKARRVLRRETEGTKTEYLAVYEPHGSGYPHLHVVLFGVARPSLGDKISQYWVDRYVQGASKDAQSCEVSRGRGTDLSNPAAYIMKYLSKSLARDAGEEATALESLPSVHGYTEFSALMWATGSRTYSMSQGLTAAVKESEPEPEIDDEAAEERDWELIGTFTGIDAGFYEGPEASRLRKWLKGHAGSELPLSAQDRSRYAGLVDLGTPKEDR
jgi:hypothetical protein